MFRVVVLERNKNFRKIIHEKFYHASFFFDIEISVQIASTVEEFSLFCKNSFFDVYIIDIDNFTEHAITLATDIKKQNISSVIVFVSCDYRLVLEGYKIPIYRYHIKTQQDEHCEKLVSDIIQKIIDSQSLICIKTMDSSKYLKAGDIMYIESYLRNSLIYPYNDDVLVSIERLSVIEQKLQSHPFVRIHTSYLVNMAFIDFRKNRTIYLKNGTVFQIPRNRYDEVKLALQSFAKNNILL